MHRYLYRLIARYLSFFAPPDARLIEVGACSRLLRDALGIRATAVYQPADTAAIGTSELLDSIEAMRRFSPDRIVINGALQVEQDIIGLLQDLYGACTPSTRLLVTYYSSLWKPILRVATALGVRTRGPEENWIAPSDMTTLLALSGFELISSTPRVLIPVRVPVVSDVVNRWLAPLPIFRWFALLNVVVARPLKPVWAHPPSVSVVVAARNESGNIESLVERLPEMGPDDELIFVEGHSTDDTWEAILATAARHPTRAITCLRQSGTGKGDAVRAGFAAATRDILMILDADLTVAPEDLPKFYRARVSGLCEFVNGTRLVYPMQRQAMNFANLIGNKFFAVAFSFLLGQPFKDTLCGTKVIDRTAYEALASGRSYFGNFDPFGDFDLLFGAGRLGLRIMELPVHYGERTYGKTNIRRWSHGWLLLRMTLFAARRVKFL
jgi:glycosyl transferase family 2